MASNQLMLGDMSKKRNKSSTKSYNNKEQLDQTDLSYNTNLAKKSHLTNHAAEITQFNSNHNSLVKNFDNSF